MPDKVTIVQMEMEWGEGVRELVAAGEYVKAIDYLVAAGQRVPDALLQTASAMLQKGAPSGTICKVERYLNRVRYIVQTRPKQFGSTGYVKPE